MIGKSQYLQPLLLHDGFPDVIVQDLLREMMNASLQLNDQTMFVAIEVGNISSDWMLAAKFNADQSPIS